MTVQQTEQNIRHTVDVIAGSVTVAALMQWLPPIAALMSIIWLGIQIYEHFSKKRKKL